MARFQLALICFAAIFTATTSQWVDCPFNAKCECMPFENVLLADCMFMPVFPVFLNYSDQPPIGAITVAGTFPTVPNNAFYHLQSMKNAQIYITNDKALRRDLTIDEDAFETVHPSSIANVTISHWSMPGIPTSALVNRTFDLYISSGNLETIGAKAFSGFSTSILEIRQNNVLTVEPNAFDGITFIGPQASTKLSLAGNGLTNISTAFKTISVGYIVLSFNNISWIDDYAFSPSESLSSLDLSFNPIETISRNAFADLPGLTFLNLNHTTLSAVPSQSLSAVTTLTTLDLSGNQLTSFEANAFYGLSLLQELNLDGNPIVEMIPGCLNGLDSLEKLGLNRLNNLSSVDVLITYGAGNLQSLQLTNCSILQTIDVSDVTKLPANLREINLQSNDVREIDADLQAWLAISSSKMLDLSNNSNFACQNTIQWMAKYAICQPAQILAQSTYCEGTGDLLISYLANFNPTCN